MPKYNIPSYNTHLTDNEKNYFHVIEPEEFLLVWQPTDEIHYLSLNSFSVKEDGSVTYEWTVDDRKGFVFKTMDDLVRVANLLPSTLHLMVKPLTWEVAALPKLENEKYFSQDYKKTVANIFERYEAMENKAPIKKAG